MPAFGAATANASPNASPGTPAGRLQQPPPLRRPRAQRLAEAIEAEIVPRLLLARPLASPDASPSDLDVATLAGLALRDEDAAARFVAAQQARGLPLEAVYLDLLAPAARQLGEGWEQDTLDFAQVTMGVFRLQRLLRELAADGRADPGRPDRRRRILLAPVPGEHHVFAVAMLAEFFRRAGWEVEAPLDASAEDLARLIAREQFAIVGLSLSGEDHLDTLPSVIRALRRARGKLGVLVGGPTFLAHPDYVTLVGADATATDARQAIRQAETLLGLVANHPT